MSELLLQILFFIIVYALGYFNGRYWTKKESQSDKADIWQEGGYPNEIYDLLHKPKLSERCRPDSEVHRWIWAEIVLLEDSFKIARNDCYRLQATIWELREQIKVLEHLRGPQEKSDE